MPSLDSTHVFFHVCLLAALCVLSSCAGTDRGTPRADASPPPLCPSDIVALLEHEEEQRRNLTLRRDHACQSSDRAERLACTRHLRRVYGELAASYETLLGHETLPEHREEAVVWRFEPVLWRRYIRALAASADPQASPARLLDRLGALGLPPEQLAERMFQLGRSLRGDLALGVLEALERRHPEHVRAVRARYERVMAMSDRSVSSTAEQIIATTDLIELQQRAIREGWPGDVGTLTAEIEAYARSSIRWHHRTLHRRGVSELAALYDTSFPDAAPELWLHAAEYDRWRRDDGAWRRHLLGFVSRVLHRPAAVPPRTYLSALSALWRKLTAGPIVAPRLQPGPAPASRPPASFRRSRWRWDLVNARIVADCVAGPHRTEMRVTLDSSGAVISTTVETTTLAPTSSELVCLRRGVEQWKYPSPGPSDVSFSVRLTSLPSGCSERALGR